MISKLVLLASVSIFALLNVANAYAFLTERTVTVNLEGRESTFTISTYDFQQTASINVSEDLLQQISDIFGTTIFTFRSTISKYESDGSFVKVAPRINAGGKLEVQFKSGGVLVSQPKEFKPEVELFNIATVPSVVTVGEEFKIKASVLNKSSETIFYSGICSSPLSAEFASNVSVEPLVVCLAFSAVELKPTETATVEGDLSESWRALSPGMTPTEVTFTYWVGDPNGGRTYTATDEFSFEVNPSSAPGMKKVTATYEGGSIDLMAFLSSGSINDVVVDPEFASLIVTVDTSSTESGELKIILPRELIDSKHGDSDDQFVTLVDGEDVDYKEVRTTATEREIAIPVGANTGEIEIIGTEVIPEFPVNLIAITAAGLIGALIALRLKYNTFTIRYYS